LGILWNDFLRRTYDRVFFADVDQFYNIDIRDVLERDLPPSVAIAMCNDGCSRQTITLRNGQPPFQFIDRKQTTCTWECARGKTRRPKAKGFEQCDNLGWGTNRNLATRNFWTRFPRKNLAYQSGVFLVDYAKLPPPGETRSAAKLLFERFPRLWRGFGDQEFFANLFYDSAAILPECYVLPMSMHHVFTTTSTTSWRLPTSRGPQATGPLKSTTRCITRRQAWLSTASAPTIWHLRRG